MFRASGRKAVGRSFAPSKGTVGPQDVFVKSLTPKLDGVSWRREGYVRVRPVGARGACSLAERCKSASFLPPQMLHSALIKNSKYSRGMQRHGPVLLVLRQ
ncbi:protein of unknown function [Methylococcus capsulatus]|uniref:Uncharacterized protein n=1 Tax=Methylococcus capsulatus TaxID=414 RepID=A0AA35UK97_METCP|nr:protein of unknown function [Methylococcus capsulatus]